MEVWPADRVECWPLGRLVPFASNAHTHSSAQVDQIAASMRQWGWTNPILVDEAGTIIAGHGRVAAVRKLGFAEAPVMVASGWSEAKKRAYVIADNQLALNAGWNEELLAAELTDLREHAWQRGRRAPGAMSTLSLTCCTPVVPHTYHKRVIGEWGVTG